MLKFSSHVSGVFPKVLKLSCAVSEYKPLVRGQVEEQERRVDDVVGRCSLTLSNTG